MICACGCGQAAHYREVIRAINSRRRAKARAAAGKYTAADFASLKRRFGLTCPACGRAEPTIKLCADHIVPLSRGGSIDIANIQPLCASCNSRKHTKTIAYEPIIRLAG